MSTKYFVNNPKTGVRQAWEIADDTYRYLLGRRERFQDKILDIRRVLWIMLNPSKATAFQDDNTLRKCLKFSSNHNFHEVEIVNLFAFRATDPRALRTAKDPVGAENLGIITEAIGIADRVVYAWGAHPLAKEQAQIVHDLVTKRRYGRAPYCLGQTKAGHPRHPLYVPYSQPMIPFEWK